MIHWLQWLCPIPVSEVIVWICWMQFSQRPCLHSLFIDIRQVIRSAPCAPKMQAQNILANWLRVGDNGRSAAFQATLFCHVLYYMYGGIKPLNSQSITFRTVKKYFESHPETQCAVCKWTVKHYDVQSNRMYHHIITLEVLLATTRVDNDDIVWVPWTCHLYFITSDSRQWLKSCSWLTGTCGTEWFWESHTDTDEV